MSKLLDACPHCGSDEYVIRITVSGTIHERHCFDGSRADNTELWDTVKHREQKRRYCADCGKALPKDAKYRSPRNEAEGFFE